MTFQSLTEILLKDNPSKELRKKKGELAEIIPEFSMTYAFDQKSVWHTMDLFEHTLAVIDGVDKDLKLRLAALFHDIGKPEAMIVDENDQGHFHGHWENSENIFLKYQNQFSLEEEDIYLVRNLIYYHDLVITDKSFDTFAREFSWEDMRLMFSLKKADILAQNPLFRGESIRMLEKEKEKYRELTYHDQKLDSYFGKEIEIEERNLLLAFFCNHMCDESFKASQKDPSETDFLVGIYHNNLFNTYLVPFKYWDKFHIPEFSWEDIACACRMQHEDLAEMIEEKEKSLGAKKFY